MKVHDLKPAPGSKRPKRRVGRGIAGKGGKTAGRGHKGQHARNTVPAYFEGGQTPLHRRVPKAKGFTNPFRIEYIALNLDTLEDFEAGAVIDPAALRDRGLIAKRGLVKVLARGSVTKAFTVRAHKFSSAAEAAIIAAGGTTESLPLPYGDRRPPARGNQHTNR